MRIDSNDVHERNAHDPIVCIAFGSWIDFNLLHPLNALFSIEVTEGGMVTFDKQKQYAKVLDSILVIDGGIVMLESDEQL